ncbi:hypothetical protein AB4619_03350 [Vibrio splendidus]
MNPDVEVKLIKGLEQLIAAGSAGIGRSVVADGYSAVDNYFSALLISKNLDNPFNHRKKLGIALNLIGSDLKAAGIKQQKIIDFYDVWQKTRYSMEPISPSDSFKYRNLADTLCSIVSAQIAKSEGICVEDLSEKIYTSLLGGRWQAYQESLSHIHEHWQSQLEQLGESGYGSKLGNKLANPSNFCELTLLSDDEFIKKALADTEVVNIEVAELYNSYLNLVTKLVNFRGEQGVELNDIPNFSLSLRMRYSGETAEETGSRFGSAFAQAIAQIVQKT